MLIVSAPLAKADVIVVLSGSSTFVERTHLAAQLYSSGVAQRILLTNDNQQGPWLSSEQRNPFFHERARWELERLGVPATNIETIMEPVSSTHDEALVVRRFAQTNNVKSLLVVTSAYHSRRALRTFRRVFANSGIPIALSAAQPGWQTPAPSRWWFSRRGWLTVPVEYVKLLYYWIRF
jgi:uncharacterized SAM-binding protein YcdF (DUF218 family)